MMRQVMNIGYWGGMLGGYTGGGGGRWSFAPATDKWKWLDSRLVTVISDRYSMNKTDNLQHAFFNAVGYESWVRASHAHRSPAVAVVTACSSVCQWVAPGPLAAQFVHAIKT
jgi:hypothetical protein